MLLPSLIGVGVFLLVPLVIVLLLSCMKWDLISPPKFVGFANFASIFTDPAIWNSLLVTVIFVGVMVPVSVFVGLGLALLLERRLPGSGLARVIMVLPWVSAPLALGMVWSWMFAPSDGLINALTGIRIEWLSDVSLALPSVIFVNCWYMVGYISLFFSAGLQGIPRPLMEAAELDGASSLQRLRYVTLPLLRPTTFFVSFTTLVWAFQVFDTVYAMTQGGPQGSTDVIATHIYQQAFQGSNFGAASAICVVVFIVLVGFTLLQQRYYSRRMTYELD